MVSAAAEQGRSMARSIACNFTRHSSAGGGLVVVVVGGIQCNRESCKVVPTALVLFPVRVDAPNLAAPEPFRVVLAMAKTGPRAVEDTAIV